MLHLVLVAAATVFGAAALGGLRGEVPMVISSIVVALGWFGFAAWGMVAIGRRWRTLPADPSGLLIATRRWLTAGAWWAPAVGLLLAFLAFIDCGPLWIPNLFHWFGLAMSALGLGALYSLPLLARLLAGGALEAAPSRRWWLVLLHCGGLALAWALVWLIPYFALLRDDVDEADYAGAPAGFLLPWPGGEDGWVIQGNNAGMNHNAAHNGQDFAYDFRRECGTPVLAAQTGEVTDVVDTNDGLGGDNNLVEVTHDDGTVASYLHIRTDSAVVATGDRVTRGDAIARVGCVGNSLTGHLHFHVRGTAGAPTIAITFEDVDGGIPRTFGSYTSGNRS